MRRVSFPIIFKNKNIANSLLKKPIILLKKIIKNKKKYAARFNTHQ